MSYKKYCCGSDFSHTQIRLFLRHQRSWCRTGRAGEGNVRATFRAWLHHSISSLTPLFFSSFHSHPPLCTSLSHLACHLIFAEWRWPRRPCRIRGHPLSPRYRNRTQRYSTAHARSHSYAPVCHCASGSLAQICFAGSDSSAFTLSQRQIYVCLFKSDSLAWLLCHFLPSRILNSFHLFAVQLFASWQPSHLTTCCQL